MLALLSMRGFRIGNLGLFTLLVVVNIPIVPLAAPVGTGAKLNGVVWNGERRRLVGETPQLTGTGGIEESPEFEAGAWFLLSQAAGRATGDVVAGGIERPDFGAFERRTMSQAHRMTALYETWDAAATGQTERAEDARKRWQAVQNRAVPANERVSGGARRALPDDPRGCRASGGGRSTRC